MDKRHKQTFHPQEYTDSKQAHKIMFDIISHKRNVNYLYDKISLNTFSCRMAKIMTKLKDKGAQNLDCSYIVSKM